MNYNYGIKPGSIKIKLPFPKREIHAKNQMLEKWARSETIKSIFKKPKRCEICGRITELIKHHSDYSKPFEIIWCCRKCHFKLHRKCY